MRYLTIEPAGGIEHGAVGRRDGVWRGSGVSHVTAAAGAAAASVAASAADPDDIVIAPVHPVYRREGDVSSFILSHASKRTILSRAAPSPHTSADPRSEILHPFLLQQPPPSQVNHAGSSRVGWTCCKQLRCKRIIRTVYVVNTQSMDRRVVSCVKTRLLAQSERPLIDVNTWQKMSSSFC